MVSTEEIIERSIYMNLLTVALKAGVTLDPEEYLGPTGLPTVQGETRFQHDKAAMSKFVYIFGIGNNQERGIKETPRISMELKGYYPGSVGMERFQIDDSIPNNPRMVETGYLSKGVTVDIHLVAKTQKDIRLLHSIMYKALPTEGYIKPFFNNKEEFMRTGLLPSENIYLEVGNYYDHQDTEHGLLEHVYTYKVTDGIVDNNVLEDVQLVPIRDITCLIGTNEQSESSMTKLHVN